MSSSSAYQLDPRSAMGASLRRVREAGQLSRDKVVDLLDERGIETNMMSLFRLEKQDNKNLVLCLELWRLYRELDLIDSEFVDQLIRTDAAQVNGVSERERLIRMINYNLPNCDISVIKKIAAQFQQRL